MRHTEPTAAVARRKNFQTLETNAAHRSNAWTFSDAKVPVTGSGAGGVFHCLEKAGIVLLLSGATMLAGCGQQESAHVALPQLPATPPAFVHPVVTRPTAGSPQVRVGAVPDGTPVTVQCGTCHAIMAPDHTTRRSEDLDVFHQGLKFAHGQITCLSCHNKDNYDRLRLASDEAVEFTEVMTLCSQCHGPQWRDYRNGAHGGMAGHWDLTKGGRIRNNCIHCHDPHSPKYQRVIPAPPPADRFVGGQKKGDGHE